MTFSKRYIAVPVFLAWALLIIGCASTGNDYNRASSEESTDIDKLLGVGDAAAEGEINEDDVLKLLGVSDEARAESQGTASEQSLATTENAEPQVSSTITERSAEAGASRNERVEPSFQTDTYYTRYQEALQSYRNKNFRESIQKFEALLSTDSKHSLADNCQYWIGESYYDLQNYQQAIVAFEKVFTYAKSNKDDSAQLKLGMCYMRLNEKEKAREEFQKLVRDYPVSEYVSIAKRFIAQIDGSAVAP